MVLDTIRSTRKMEILFIMKLNHSALAALLVDASLTYDFTTNFTAMQMIYRLLARTSTSLLISLKSIPYYMFLDECFTSKLPFSFQSCLVQRRPCHIKEPSLLIDQSKSALM